MNPVIKLGWYQRLQPQSHLTTGSVPNPHKQSPKVLDGFIGCQATGTNYNPVSRSCESPQVSSLGGVTATVSTFQTPGTRLVAGFADPGTGPGLFAAV